MAIVLFGQRGQLGQELAKILPTVGNLVISDCDVTNHADVAQVIIATQPSLIFNATAYTNVDGAESNKLHSFAVNCDAVAHMADCAKHCGALLIHYSTDYVFNGDGHTPWTEDDKPSPLNIYGETKYAGDTAIQNSGCHHLIFRTSWLYGAGKNFPNRISELAQNSQPLRIVNNQWGAPTSTAFLAKASIHAALNTLQNPEKQGLYNLCCEGQTNWYDFATHILRTKNIDCDITAVTSDDYPSPAKRPLNSRLNCQKFIDSFGITPPAWQDAYNEWTRTNV